MKATYNIRTHAQIVALHTATTALIAPKLAGIESNRLAAIAARTRATNKAGAGRRAVRDAISVAARNELARRAGW